MSSRVEIINFDDVNVEVNDTGYIVELIPIGERGPGVPEGGLPGQILVKNTSNNYETRWTSNINIDTARFNMTVNATPNLATLSWNFEEKTLEFGKSNDTVLQIGQETLYPLVYNADSITLTRGTVVMVDPTQPAQGNKIRVKRMVSDGTLPAKLLVGLVTENFANGSDGFVTWFGLLRNISLSAKQPGGETWAEGDVLWCNPSVAGGLTKIEPIAPNLKISVCAIVSINGNNVNVLVRPWLSDDLKDLHDVNVTNVTSNQAILWNAVSNTWTASNVVTIVNGKTNVVVLDSNDIGAETAWTVTTSNTGTLTGVNVLWLADTSAARNRTIDVNGERLQVKDTTGSAGTNNITLTAGSGQTINGNSNETIDVNYGWVEYVRSGTNWVTIGGQ